MTDLRYALRTLARSPGLTLAAVLTLGLGIGANTAMFGVVDRLFFRPPAHVVDPDRLVRVNVTWKDPFFGTLTGWPRTYPRYEDFRDHARSFIAVATYGRAGFSLGVGEHAQHVSAKLVTGSFFVLLGVRQCQPRRIIGKAPELANVDAAERPRMPTHRLARHGKGRSLRR